MREKGILIREMKNKKDIERISNLEQIHEKLFPVYETVKKLKKQLPKDVPLIGFAGAPWTLATALSVTA